MAIGKFNMKEGQGQIAKNRGLKGADNSRKIIFLVHSGGPMTQSKRGDPFL
jgi:hypothetical protein